MDRGALLLYLRDLRDLEIAKKKIETIFNYEKAKYEQEQRSLNATNLVNIPEKKSGWSVKRIIGAFLSLFGGGGMMLWFIYLMAFGTTEKSFQGTVTVNGKTYNSIEFEKVPIGVTPVLIICTIAAIVIILLGVYTVYNAIKETKENKTEIENAKNHNEIQRLNVQKNSNLSMQKKKQWEQRANFLRKEYKKISSLLESNYSLNILANQYRNLPSLYYIYDYMSSSQETLKDTLLHEHMENGIQRLLERLDYIIEQNQQIIFQNRLQESANSRMIEQNNKMLNSLKETEQNVRIATQYAEISANYNKVTAYFSLANYLKD